MEKSNVLCVCPHCKSEQKLTKEIISEWKCLSCGKSILLTSKDLQSKKIPILSK